MSGAEAMSDRKRSMVFLADTGETIPMPCPSEDSCGGNELYVNADGDHECACCGSKRLGIPDTRPVSRAEFEALTSRVEATIACLWAMHSPCDVRESRYVKCAACQAIRDLQAGVGYGA